MAWTKASEQDRREQMIDAALRVASRDGLAKLTVRAVATEVGVSHGLVLFHFSTRAALLEGLLDRLLAWFLEAVPPPHSARDLIDVMRDDVTSADVDRDKVAVLLDYWVVGARTPALRGRLRDAIAQYERLREESAVDDDTTQGVPASDATRQQLAALGTVVIFGTALRALLEDDPERAEEARREPLDALEHLLTAQP